MPKRSGYLVKNNVIMNYIYWNITKEDKVMKKALYAILLLVEFLIGFFLLFSAATLIGGAFGVGVFVVWAALLVWQIVKLKKATEIKAKRKAKVLIALIMALPAVASLVAILIIGALYF